MPRLVLLVFIIASFSTRIHAADEGTRITAANAARLKSIAVSDRRVIQMDRGPGSDEMIFKLRRGEIQIVDAESLLPKKDFGRRSSAFVVSHDQRLVGWTNYRAGKTTITNMATRKSIEFKSGKSPHRSTFSPDNKLIAIGDTVTTDPKVEGSGYAVVRLFDTATGKLVHKLDAGSQGYGAVRPAFSPNGKVLAVGNRNYETRLFDVASGKELHVLPKRMTQGIAFSPNSKMLAAGYVDGTLGVWNVDTGKEIHLKPSGYDEVYCVDWNPSGDLLAISGRGGASVWDPNTLTQIKELIDLPWVIETRFIADGTRLLTSGSLTRVPNRFSFNVWTVDGEVIGKKPAAKPKWKRPKPMPDGERPNILFAIADDWGFPHASVYGDPVVKTPHFDRIAREGVLFKHAFVSSPSCTPSRGAILTGKYHWQLKGAANLWSVFPDEFTTYPELLKQKAGYFTGFQGKGWGPGKTATPKRELTGKRFKNFKQFLKERPKDSPFCYWLGTSDPHRPFTVGAGQVSGMDLSKIEVPKCFPDSATVRNDIADYYFEVQRFDALVGEALKSLEAAGELDNTIVIMTSDHGMPFPRCKSNLYDTGARVPLAIRFGKHVPANRTVEDFVSLVDLAPTFLDLAGLYEPKDEQSDRSLWSLLKSNKSGHISGRKTLSVVFGKERHVPSQEAPNMGGYPSRALRTKQFLFIRNYAPNRWPNGTPEYKNAAIPGAWYADTDNGPTKTYMIKNRDKDSHHRNLYDLSFAKRPEIELYDLRHDPHQLNNIAEVINYRAAVQLLGQQLQRALRATGDPRATGESVDFDAFPYLGGAPKYPGDGNQK